jgi:hypothetical protein
MHRAQATPKDVDPDVYRAACDRPMVDVARIFNSPCVLATLDHLVHETLVKKVASELKARAVFAERSIPAPSSEFRRAIMGRYAALGIV